MRIPVLASVSAVAVLAAVACSSGSDRAGFGDPPPADAADGGGPVPPPLAGQGGARPMVSVTLTGTVYAPNGTLPLSNALVYVSGDPPAAIPEGAYCDQCVKLPEGTFAVSAADGTFSIDTQVPAGKIYVVVVKGQFRRVRELDVDKAGGTIALDKDHTTLPGKADASKGDDVPKMAVLKDDSDFDKIDQSLQKLGITDFEVKQDRSLLANQAELLKYHVVFVPCGGSSDPMSNDAQSMANMQKFVETGGKLYVTDWSYEFVRQPFPGFLNWEGETAELGSAATGDEWDAPATATDQGLADWLAATGDPTFQVQGNWTTINGVNTVTGKDVDGNPTDITPKVWVTANKNQTQMRPTTVSFQDQCGRVLFSTYHTEDGSFGGGGGAGNPLTAQEKALLYILLEVGVCVGERPGVH